MDDFRGAVSSSGSSLATKFSPTGSIRAEPSSQEVPCQNSKRWNDSFRLELDRRDQDIPRMISDVREEILELNVESQVRRGLRVPCLTDYLTVLRCLCRPLLKPCTRWYSSNEVSRKKISSIYWQLPLSLWWVPKTSELLPFNVKWFFVHDLVSRDIKKVLLEESRPVSRDLERSPRHRYQQRKPTPSSKE